jgi:hypothetical protein
MPDEALAAVPEAERETARPPPAGAPDAASEIPPTGQVVTDTLTETADATGTIKATRQMPVPDSLGG